MTMKILTHEEKLRLVTKVLSKFGRELSGDEYDKVYTMLALLEPHTCSNNQHSWTNTYIVGDLQYDMTFGIFDEPIISVKEI